MLQVTEEERLKSNDAKAVGINSKCDQSSMSMSDRIKPVLHPKKKLVDSGYQPMMGRGARVLGSGRQLWGRCCTAGAATLKT